MVYPLGLALAFSFVSSDSNSQFLLDSVNEYRNRHGLESLTLEASLCKVASGHAKFMDSNQVLSHFEKREMKDFYGEDLAERAATVNWQDDLSELVGFARSNTSDAIQAIFDSPCHRIRFLKPGKLKLGASSSGDFVCLLIGGEESGKSVVSPPDGSENVPVSWSANDDLSGTCTGFGSKEFGYPITYTDGSLAKSVKTWSFVLTDQNITEVAGRKIGTHDSRFPNSLVFVPNKSLEAGSKYFAKVSFTLENGSEVHREWSFQTGKGR